MLAPPQSAPQIETEAASALLAVVTRGRYVESVHRGHVAVVDGLGRLVAHAGDPDAVTFLRSSAKPFQALPVVTAGAADRFGFTDAELALLCGSHGGEPVHTRLALSMLKKAGFAEADLQCGTHEPYDPDAARRLKERGEAPSPVFNNCSGKHAGMLALARHLGAPTETYRASDHPVQQQILSAVARFAVLPLDAVGIAGDGCGVPTFAVPVRVMAEMYARLVRPPDDFDAPTRAACGRLVAAMMAHPELVEGTDLESCLDTALMQALPGRLVSKVGAEGVYTAGVVPGDAWPCGLGIAFKIEDGDPEERARAPFAIALLDRLGVLDDSAREALAGLVRKPVCDHRGDEVGEVQPACDLAWFHPDRGDE